MEQIEEYIKEYKNASNKIEYFQNLSNEEKQELYKNMTLTEQKELLSVLPFQYIKDFILILEKQEQQEVYKNLNDNQLKAIYNTFNEAEKKDMIIALESRQNILNDRMSEARSNIGISTSNIERATNSIETSKTNITINKQNIKEKKQELKANKVVLKKLDRERKRNLRKVMRSKKRLNGRLSRIGIISKYRTKKYMDRLNALEQSNINIDAQNFIIQQTNQEIKDLRENIEKEKLNIEKQHQTIKEEHKNINANVSRIDRTEKQIRKLSASEKKVLGRKLYNKVVLERDCIVVRKKKEQEKKVENTQSKQIVETNNQQVERISPNQTEVIEPQHNNTEQMVNNMINNANRLQGMGVNFCPPANIIGSIQGPELLQNPIMQINQQQLILASYTMMAIYNYALQQMMLQQQQQNQELANGRSRTLSPNSRGSVSLILLASLIFFILGLFLFIIN